MAMWNKYADTAARKHGKPGREQRPKSTTIDAHTHVAVPRAAEFIKPHLDLSTIPLAHFSSQETRELNAKQEADIGSRIRGNYDERFADMDKMGVDMQLVMPPPPQLWKKVLLRPRPKYIATGPLSWATDHITAGKNMGMERLTFTGRWWSPVMYIFIRLGRCWAWIE